MKNIYDPKSSKYLTENGEVFHQKLSNWGTNSSLVQVVQQIFSDLVREGSLILVQKNTLGQSIPFSQSTAVNFSYDNLNQKTNGQYVLSKQQNGQPISSQQQNNLPQQSDYQLPPIPESFEQLNCLTIEQLLHLCNDEQAFLAFYYSLPYIKDITSVISSIENENLKMAEEKKKKDEFYKQKIEELELKKIEIKQLEEKRNELNEKKKKIDERFTPDKVIAKLDSFINDSDAVCDEITSNFSGEEVSSFMKKYLDARTKYHLIKLKRKEYANRNAQQHLI